MNSKAINNIKEILEIIESLNLEYDIEKSFKIIKSTILQNRFLIGIRCEKKSVEQITYICTKMNMPDKQLKIFLENLSDANMLLLGFEENENHSIYKIYLEFWDRLKNRLYNQPKHIKSELLYIGFKWNQIDNTNNVITKYICHPLLTVRSIVKRISSFYNNYDDKTSLHIVNDIIKIADKRIVNDSFIYLEVSEENNPRESFDINLYKANLQVKDIYPILLKICHYYSINCKDFDLLYSHICDKNLGHLSGGIDREGRDFITIYYEV